MIIHIQPSNRTIDSKTVHHKTISIINNFINLFAAQVINGLRDGAK